MKTETNKFFLTEIGSTSNRNRNENRDKRVFSTTSNSNNDNNNVSNPKIDPPQHQSFNTNKEISHKLFQDQKLSQSRASRAVDGVFFPNITQRLTRTTRSSQMTFNVSTAPSQPRQNMFAYLRQKRLNNLQHKKKEKITSKGTKLLRKCDKNPEFKHFKKREKKESEKVLYTTPYLKRSGELKFALRACKMLKNKKKREMEFKKSHRSMNNGRHIEELAESSRQVYKPLLLRSRRLNKGSKKHNSFF